MQKANLVQEMHAHICGQHADFCMQQATRHVNALLPLHVPYRLNTKAKNPTNVLLPSFYCYCALTGLRNWVTTSWVDETFFIFKGVWNDSKLGIVLVTLLRDGSFSLLGESELAAADEFTDTSVPWSDYTQTRNRAKVSDQVRKKHIKT